MRHEGRCALLAAAATLAACSGDTDFFFPPLFVPPAPPVPLVQVSGLTGFAIGCDQQAATGTLHASSEVEPWLAVNPTNPDNLIGVWQQDRWSDGGARGLVAGVSLDGGATWSTRTAPFSRCTGGTLVNGGDYARATDPWVTFGPDGVAYWMAMVITGDLSGMRVSRSTDGGDTWEAPIPLIDSDAPLFNDKNSITADPTDANYVYAVWDQLNDFNNSGPTVFARTADGGDTWERARAIYDPGLDAQTLGNLIGALPDGTLLNLFTEIHYFEIPSIRVIRSTDHGDTWSAPVLVADLYSIGTYDEETGQEVRSGSILASMAIGPGDDVWVAWQDGRFYYDSCPAPDPSCVGLADSVVLAHSPDGGVTWEAPVLVPQEPTIQAFTPSVSVAADGTLGVAYYDFRDDAEGDAYLLTSYWLATSTDGVNWTERRISGPFDLRIAPDARGLFLGDYQGLVSAGTDFIPFFAQTYPSLGNRTNVNAVALPAVPAAKAAATPYRARLDAVPRLTPELLERVRSNAERSRHHFKEQAAPPAFPRGYLR